MMVIGGDSLVNADYISEDENYKENREYAYDVNHEEGVRAAIPKQKRRFYGQCPT